MKYRQQGKHTRYYIHADENSDTSLYNEVDYIIKRGKYLGKVFEKLNKQQKFEDKIYVYCYEYSNIKSTITVVFTNLRLTTKEYLNFVADMKLKYKHFKDFAIKENCLCKENHYYN